MLVGGVNPTGKVTLSRSERDYISRGVRINVRSDGRACLDWRPISAELNPVPQAVGSARLRVGGTDVLVSVKSNIGVPLLGHPDEGQIVCTVDSSTVLSMNSNSSGTNEERLMAERNAELTAILNDILVVSGAIDKKMFKLVSGRHCWVLYIDVLVLEYDGNLIDTMVMGTKLALSSTKLPSVRVEEGGEGMEIILTDEVDYHRMIPKNSLPTCITIGKINEGFVIDLSASEEVCCDAALIISVTTEGKVAAMRKLGCGMIDPGLLKDYISTAVNCAAQFGLLVDRLFQT